MGKYINFLFLLLPLSAAFAETATPEDSLFTCTFDNGAKTVSLTMVKSNTTPKVQYIFGPTGGKPELDMLAEFRPETDKDGYRLWADEGQTGIRIYVDDYVYDVEPWLSGAKDEGYLNVTKSEQDLFVETCDDGSLITSLDPLWEELDAKGWYYIYDSVTIGWVNKEDIK